MLDWRLDPKAGQNDLNDLYSALAFKPRTWLTAESQVRYDLDRGNLNMAFHQLTFAPNDRWSWGIGHWYLRGGTWGNGPGRKQFHHQHLVLPRGRQLGLRATHNYNAASGRLQDQFYTLYRDLRTCGGGAGWGSSKTVPHLGMRLSRNAPGGAPAGGCAARTGSACRSCRRRACRPRRGSGRARSDWPSRRS